MDEKGGVMEEPDTAGDVGGASVGIAEDFDVSDPVMDHSCYEIFGALREAAPVAWSSKLGGYWVVSTQKECAEVFKDPGTFSSAEIAVPPMKDPWGPFLPQQLDPPDHLGYRRDLNAILSPARVAAAEPGGRALARALLEAIRDAGRAEMIADFAAPFTTETSIGFLGIPTEDIPMLMAQLAALREDYQTGETGGLGARPKIYEYLGSLIQAAREERPDDQDAVAWLGRAKHGDTPFTRDEQIRTLNLCMNAALDTTLNMVGMTFWFLAAHPDHMRELAADSRKIPLAVEEFLRYFSGTAIARVVTKDTTLASMHLKAGDLLELELPSAGRDSQAFEDADSVRFDRNYNPHITFGVGPHSCLGRHLARMELRVALEELVVTIPSLRLAAPDDVRWRSFKVRGIENVEIVVD
jgi:cytochrome P450